MTTDTFLLRCELLPEPSVADSLAEADSEMVEFRSMRLDLVAAADGVLSIKSSLATPLFNI